MRYSRDQLKEVLDAAGFDMVDQQRFMDKLDAYQDLGYSPVPAGYGFEQDHARLLKITNNCRPDMHEPDEQGIVAKFGPEYVQAPGGQKRQMKTVFDNACTGECSSDMGFWIIDTSEKGNGKREWFNLAVIVAMARAWDGQTEDKKRR